MTTSIIFSGTSSLGRRKPPFVCKICSFIVPEDAAAAMFCLRNILEVVQEDRQIALRK